MASLTKIKNKKHEHTTLEQKLNTLRAGVLGSNDGILTVVGVLFSVAVATSNRFTIFIAGLADLLACAFSMASGEFASVSTQKDTEKAAVMKEQRLLKQNYAQEVQTVAAYYHEQGVTHETAIEIARELMQKKPLETLTDVKYNLKLGQYMNPWDAAVASLISAMLGGVFPLAAMTLSPANYMWQATIFAVCLSVSLTGYLSAKLGNGLVKIAILRNLLIGILTMIIHYSVGILL
ncbi:VIT family protein [Liquorilactobacillus satsumensis]|nr:VIT family protein [Liquorilactobacillus satsumensis]MCC7666002.1 VIT family protein [Liquorilactobacillus satsumensis]MCP9313928.1 VIT family protein [Liquorilactobacillus satsumensis]MCP9329331.1 VIT family protein [Liquorilactobacillus satsumensis]MCP9358661.1 VIT family protein [Liquorilactobacillus satsumensis]MCP9361057.1 VIT family protein [Liquorilactobacillus satsumensis]